MLRWEQRDIRRATRSLAEQLIATNAACGEIELAVLLDAAL